jgi:hypothetical protein
LTPNTGMRDLTSTTTSVIGSDHDPTDHSTLPQDMLVDHVRVWQRKEESPVDGWMTDTPKSKNP